MTVVSYAAKRELVAGVSVDDTVVLDLRVASLDIVRSVERTTHVALSGSRETVYIRGEMVWTGSTRPLTGNDVAAVVMFLASVESGQTFSFAPYDASTDSPIDYRNVYLRSEGFQQGRAVVRGGGGGGDYFTFNFEFVEVP